MIWGRGCTCSGERIALHSLSDFVLLIFLAGVEWINLRKRRVLCICVVNCEGGVGDECVRLGRMGNPLRSNDLDFIVLREPPKQINRDDMQYGGSKTAG